MRVATWNIKQIAPRKPLAQRLDWMVNNIGPDIAVLTEADLKVPITLDRWAVAGRAEPLGKGQNFSTFVVSPRYTLSEIRSVKRRMRTYELDLWYPGIFAAADVFDGRDHVATVVGVYAVTRDPDGTKVGAGYNSMPRILDDLELLMSARQERVIVAGDLNLWPRDVAGVFEEVGLIDLLDATSEWRDPLPGCTNCGLGPDCGHLWTHKNGRADGNGRPHQIDYIFCSEDLVDSLEDLWGGVHHFDDVLDYSDHAPVIADFTM